MNRQSGSTIVAGVFPMAGRYSVTVWAMIIGCCRKTVERHVAAHGVRHRRIGDVMFIDAEDFWNALPQLKGSEPPRKGGNRKRRMKP